MKIFFLSLLLVSAFALGFAFNAVITHSAAGERKKVTGIGGVFFKSENPAKLKEWYKAHLGFETDQYGALFVWRFDADSTQKGYTQWSPFNAKTKYFEPSAKDFMFNYIVKDLELLASDLKQEGVTIVDTIESFSYGKFLHIIDPEGNKIELWEPQDPGFDK